MIKIGDRVEVVGNMETYSSYYSWVERNAPFHLQDFKASGKPHNGDVGEVIQIVPHSVGAESDLYFVEFGDKYMLFHEDGLEVLEDNFLYDVGDKVVIVEDGSKFPGYYSWVKRNAPDYMDAYRNDRHLMSGDFGTVVGIGRHLTRSSILYMVEKNGRVVLVMEDGLDMVEEKSVDIAKNGFSKSDLEAGMVVELRNGDRFLVLINTIGFNNNYKGDSLLLDKELGAISLTRYTKNFKDELVSGRDIVEVRKLNIISDMFEEYHYEGLEILWQEKDEDVHYAVGIKFGDTGESIWKTEGAVCNIGDILEVVRNNKKDLIKVVREFKSTDSDEFGRTIRRVYTA